MKDIAAVILCAGKGSRMNDDSTSKVCFDCAGVPVIRRIINNMKAAGVKRFVVVIGHQAYSVMDCLDGVDGVVYAYQKEQKGTGHAAYCGLKALETIGHTGPTLVSMGDKIISPKAVRELVERAETAKVVWSVQPVASNFGGGRVVLRDGKPLGVVEFTDEVLEQLIEQNAPFEMQGGGYGCSTVEIDMLCDLLNRTEGVLGSQLVGAGLGGCVVALIRKDAAASVIETVNKGYYDRFGFAHSAMVYSASNGSSVMY